MSVYFVTCREQSLCKIGTARNAKSRFSQLQTASIFPLVLEATIPGSVELERELHDRFKEHRVKGEWFRITEELDALIKESASIICLPDPEPEPAPERELARRTRKTSEKYDEACKKAFTEAMEAFARLGPCPETPMPLPRRFYNPVPLGGGQFNARYAVRGEGGHRNRLLGRDLNLSWDKADRLCDLLEEVRQYALQEGVEA